MYQVLCVLTNHSIESLLLLRKITLLYLNLNLKAKTYENLCSEDEKL